MTHADRQIEKVEKQTARVREALRLVKIHISEEDSQQNRDLHEAVQLMVTFARELGYLRP